MMGGWVLTTWVPARGSRAHSVVDAETGRSQKGVQTFLLHPKAQPLKWTFPSPASSVMHGRLPVSMIICFILTACTRFLGQKVDDARSYMMPVCSEPWGEAERAEVLQGRSPSEESQGLCRTVQGTSRARYALSY